MYDLDLHFKAFGAVLELKHAPGISRRKYFNVGPLDLLHLPIQDLHGEFVLGDIVCPGAAATLICTLNFNELYSGNCF